MTLDELREEVSIELEFMGATVKESATLLHDISVREPSVREKTAAAAFLAQFYNGIKNILKRIHRYHDIPMPAGKTWHAEIFRRFCDPPFPPFLVVFDEWLATELLPFRKFRHVVFHGYGFQIDGERMKEGLEKVEEVYKRFAASILDYITLLEG
jgi:hypothetical protein